jgi:hypothetical protein
MKIISKKIILSLCLCIFVFNYISAQNDSVSQAEMQKIYNEVKTPYKYGLVVAPEDPAKMTDCPVVFRHNNRWFMTYFVFDGKGYETWLSESEDLLKWKTTGKILSFRDGAWDGSQRGGYPALPDMEWGGSYGLQPYKDKYRMTYIGGANEGYEAQPLSIGLAFTDKDNLGKAQEWQSLDKPVLSPDDKNGQWFDSITQYKSTTIKVKREPIVKAQLDYTAQGVC